jgi:hypothetical protein
MNLGGRLPQRLARAGQLPFLLAVVLRQLGAQRRFLRRALGPALAHARAQAQREAVPSLDGADFRKLTDYYGLAVPAILGEAFCALRGWPMTPRERLASTCQGAMTGLGDDFFDKSNLSTGELQALLRDQPGHNAGQQLAQYLLHTAEAQVPDRAASQAQLGRVLSAQIASKQQIKLLLSHSQLVELTWAKGGESLLYYRTAYAHPLPAPERAALYHLGGLMQLGNDIFDVYEDCQAGVQTLATTAGQVAPLRAFFLGELAKARALTWAMPYPPGAIRWFWGLLSLAVFSRCLVCLDQLAGCEAGSGGEFRPHQYPRQALICDMERWANRWRSIYYWMVA